MGFAAAFRALWFGLYTLLFNWAGHYLDAGTVALVVNFAPLIVGIGAVVFFKEAFSRPLFAGMIISLSGIALIGVAGEWASWLSPVWCSPSGPRSSMPQECSCRRWSCGTSIRSPPHGSERSPGRWPCFPSPRRPRQA
ncbi:DMT family transporter [Nesterenkonia pannonica]|uniref:DMT family transporter n=1 Tax=Nesterenkonia pannonica TaxID=1548602 RepID=UPI002164B917|nr:DMT family transporter [Nesterenkonia pannonica]